MALPHHVIGDGPDTVFMLHGWFGSSDGWGTLPQWLDTGARRYVFVDYRGHGRRLHETGRFTLDEIADDVLALADELGAARFALVGHSMGGAAVQRVLARAPQRVSALVGITPVGATPTPFDDASRALFEGAAASVDNRQAIIGFTTGNRHTPRWTRHVAQQSMQRSTPQAVAGYLQAWAGADFADDVRGASLPVLAIVGEHDPALSEDTVRQTWGTLYPDFRLVVLGNAGHYPMDETPVALATCIDAFLDGVAG